MPRGSQAGIEQIAYLSFELGRFSFDNATQPSAETRYVDLGAWYGGVWTLEWRSDQGPRSQVKRAWVGLNPVGGASNPLRR